MQVQVVQNGSVDAFNMLLYPDQHPNNQQYLYDKIAGFSQTLGAATDAFTQQFAARAMEMYNKAYDSQAMNAARAAIRVVKNVFNPNSIVPLETVEELRAAQVLMQRYLMANPVVRGLYLDQRIDGYSDSYRNIHGNAMGDAHYDYRRVMDGIVQFNDGPNTEEPDFKTTFFFEDLIPGDTELTFPKQNDILSGWDAQNVAVSQLQDPTDIFGGRIGA